MDLDQLLERAGQLLDRLEGRFGLSPALPADWQALAFRWRPEGVCRLEAVVNPRTLHLDDLHGIDRQKETLVRNTRQFVRGFPANNALLWGARGTGKSSLVKALLPEFAPQGLRIIEVEKHQLTDLPEIVTLIEGRPERFIIYCDDLSFEADDPRYKALKVVLDGSIAAPPDNVLIYATSNRRHLMPEFLDENLAARPVREEIHLGETIEEKVSLSDRFGLWLSFYPFNQEEYLEIVWRWLEHFGIDHGRSDAIRQEAIRWELGRGTRSGRTAWQFARDYAGRTLSGNPLS